MSLEKYDPNCPGCKPVAMNLDGTPLPAHHAMNVALSALWDDTDLATKMAFHRCTCLSGRNVTDLALCNAFIQRLEGRLKN